MKNPQLHKMTCYFWQFIGQELIAQQLPFIEVKTGKSGRLKSLYLFLAEKKSPFGIRISTNPLGFNKQILDVPLYMLHELERLVREAINNE